MCAIRRAAYRKGIGLIFPNRNAGIYCGNATELGDIGRAPGKSSLFFLTTYHPEIRLPGARVSWSVKQRVFVLSGAVLTVLENPRERIIFVSGRTHNRSRSPR